MLRRNHQRALEEETLGIKINGTPINDTICRWHNKIVEDCIEDLQRLIDREECDLILNVKATAFVKISKQREDNQKLVHAKRIEQVQIYTYPGTIVTSNNDYSNEIRVRIEKTRITFIKVKKVLGIFTRFKI